MPSIRGKEQNVLVMAASMCLMTCGCEKSGGGAGRRARQRGELLLLFFTHRGPQISLLSQCSSYNQDTQAIALCGGMYYTISRVATAIVGLKKYPQHLQYIHVSNALVPPPLPSNMSRGKAICINQPDANHQPHLRSPRSVSLVRPLQVPSTCWGRVFAAWSAIRTTHRY